MMLRLVQQHQRLPPRQLGTLGQGQGERLIERRPGDFPGLSCLSAIGIASPFANYMHAGYGVDAGRWPKLAAFLKRVHTRPSFAACLEEERQALKAAAA